MTDALLCHHCGCTLTPGAGNFYVVKIEAVADPTPPGMTGGDLERDLRGEMAELLEEMSGQSERELVDDVYRRLTIHLCGKCFRVWIENPCP